MDPARPLYEIDPAGAGDPGGTGAEPPVPAPEPAADPAGEAGAGESWAPSREEWEQTQEALRGLEPLAEMARGFDPSAGGEPGYGQQGDGQQGPGQPELPDPFSPNYSAEMAAFLEQRDQALMDRLAPVTERVYMGEAEQRLEQALGQLPPDLRDLGLGEDHSERSQEALTHMAAAFFRPDAPLEQVMQQSGEYLRDLISLAKDRGRDEYIASLKGDGGERQPDEPPIGGAGIEGVAQPRSYDEIINRGLSGRLAEG